MPHTDQGYRWNLDYVVDAHGNSMTYFYSNFTSYLGLSNNQVVAPYDLSSTLDHIDYGTRAGTEGAAPAPMQVWFDKANRCLVADCNPNVNWPDTPRCGQQMVRTAGKLLPLPA
jgi:hypothetical protein